MTRFSPPDSAPATAVIVVAAGAGSRLGQSLPKAFVPLAGRTILAHALQRVFQTAPTQVIVVAPVDFVAQAESDAAGRAAVVIGGATRQQSVAAGLAALTADIEVVLVHDAARAFTPPEQIDAVRVAVRGENGVIPALPVVNTLKRVAGDEIIDVVDRAGLVAAQTPQGFPRAALVAAYAVASEEYTDDAALFQAAGHRVAHITGSPDAFKITTPDDLSRARALAGEPAFRVGVGTDVHAFGGDGSLWLAGIQWPGEPALSGHSDGDAVAHAIVDALLGAAGLGDIGEHFGTSHPEYAGAHADVFLARTREIVAEAGYLIGNVSVQFQGNRPRFSARRAEAEQVLSAALGAPVSVSATTTDGLGFTGRGEGIAATATALVYRRS